MTRAGHFFVIGHGLQRLFWKLPLLRVLKQLVKQKKIINDCFRRENGLAKKPLGKRSVAS